MIPNEYPSLNFDLGETADMLRDSIRSFASDELAPRAADIDRENEFPMDMWRKMGDLGILGVTASEEYGGAGMGYLEHVIAMEEISRASAVRTSPSQAEAMKFTLIVCATASWLWLLQAKAKALSASVVMKPPWHMS